MKYLCAQPANLYFAWQVETMLFNFDKMGVPMSDVHVLCANPEGGPPDYWFSLRDRFSSANFYFYVDDRPQDAQYPSSIRPWIIAKHLTQYPALQTEPIFYHDCDIIWVDPLPTWSPLLQGQTWWLSDTRFYIGAEYVQSKEPEIYPAMCQIVGIDPAVPVANELNSGGAQYLMKDLTPGFWEKVYQDSEDLFVYLRQKAQESTLPRPIQHWTADMWAVLWNAWVFGYETRVTPVLSFMWPGRDLATRLHPAFDERIMHNAGVTESGTGMFFKHDFTHQVPYGASVQVDDDKASWLYWQAVQEAGVDSVLPS